MPHEGNRAGGPCRIAKVAVTGGGCAGKTKFMRLAQEEAEGHGWSVLTVPESPTAVMENGVRPGGRVPFAEYERTIFDIQVAWESAMAKTARTMEGSDPVLVLCDRGLPDIAAYMDAAQYAGLLAELGMTPDEARDAYDAVIHLVSVVDGAPDLYGKHNNAERYETPEEAMRQELRVRQCWEGAAHLHVIPATKEPVAAKMAAALAALGAELGWVDGFCEPRQID